MRCAKQIRSGEGASSISCRVRVQPLINLLAWPPQPCPLPSTHAAENGQDANASMTNALEQTRRETLLLGAAALVSSLAQNVEAGQDTERHGISSFGDLKYPPDFKHFDYVNPNAPKGGVFSHIGATRAFNQNYAMNITAIAKLPSRGSLPEAIYSGRNSPRAPGQRATTSRRSARGASSAMSFQTTPLRARRVGSSIRDGKNCRISVCGRPSSMHSISNGPTRRSCTGPIKGPIRYFRIPT